MAYVDLDLVKESLLGWHPNLDDKQIEYMLDTIPTVEVEEVKHGEWIRDNTILSPIYCNCSLCGNLAEKDSNGNYIILTPYCSECGAKMDERRDT